MSTVALHSPMILDWSDEDQGYVVTMLGLPGCRTHGSSYEEVALKGQAAIDSWVEAVVERGRPLPERAAAVG